MAEHELKTWPEPFEATLRGAKAFEFRRDDRSPRFEVDDRLVLREFVGHSFTGRVIEAGVSYVLRDKFGVPPGYAVLGLIGVRQRRDQAEEDRLMVERLTRVDSGLTEWEVGFVESIARQVASGCRLTPAQRERAQQIDAGR